MQLHEGTNHRVYWVDDKGRATRATDVHRCTWFVEIATEDGPAARECGSPAAEGADFDGWACTAGHRHYSYGGRDWAERAAQESFLALAGASDDDIERIWI